MKQDALKRATEALHTASAENEESPALSKFLEILAALGRGELEITPEERNAFLSDTASLVNNAYLPLNDYLSTIEVLLTHEFYSDEWIRISERRSRLEFVRTLYGDILDRDWNLFLDCENLDDMLRQKGDYEGGGIEDQVPTGTPLSHWWWWYPSPPPVDVKD